MDDARVLRRQEQEPHRNKGDGQRCDQPRPPPPEPRARAVAEMADQRVGGDVAQAREKQDGADAGEPQAERLRIEGRQINEQRQPEDGGRQRRQPVGPHDAARQPADAVAVHGRTMAVCATSIDPARKPASQ
jgi:hypothetical protein